MSSKSIAISAFLSSTVIAMAAAAQTAQTTDIAGAEALLRDGRALLEQKNFAAACPKLAEANRLDPQTETLLALATCHEGEGKTASAVAEYKEVASRSRQEGRSDREQAARAKGAALEPTLSTLTIVPSRMASATVGLIVKRNGVVVAVDASPATVPVDPGEQSLEATAPGKLPFTASVVVGTGGDKKTVEIPRLQDDIAGGTPGALGLVYNYNDRPTPSLRLTRLQTGAIAAGAAGLAAIGVGAFFGLRAIKLNDDSKAGCDGDACDPAAKQQRLDARSAGNWSTVLFAVGGVLVAGGTTMFVLGRSKETGGSGVNVTAAASGDGGSFLLSGRF